MKRILDALKRNLIAGVLIIVPAGVTIWLVVTLWRFLNRPLYEFFGLFARDPAALSPQGLEGLVGWCLEHRIDLSGLSRIPGIGLFLVLAMIYLLGMTARSILGRALISLGEKLVKRVPLVGTIYGSLKQVMETVISGSTGAFRQAVLIEYPRAGLWSVAFLTAPVPQLMAAGSLAPEAGEKDGAQPANDLGEKVFAFVPTTPNPTSGMLVMVSRESVIPLNLSVDEAIKLVVSGGILAPTAASPLPPPVDESSRSGK